MNFLCKHFNELSVTEIYDIMQLRSDIFVIEQNCIYRDADDKDKVCHHLFAYHNNQLAAYSRLVPPGVSYNNMVSIGRVCTAKKNRMDGFGLQLMSESIKCCKKLWPSVGICISAQAYLEKFYLKFGFVTVSKPYLEDDIPHIKMILAN